MPVQGIGGLFFRARDPDGLARWYRTQLGVGGGCSPESTDTGDDWHWQVAAGPVVFAPFAEDSDYFAADRQYMLNLRVTDLAGLLDRLAGAGIEAITRPDWDDPKIGRFARIHDPEGNPIELWEPPAA
jgi:hypothetical protein